MNLLGFACAGSNPAVDELETLFFFPFYTLPFWPSPSISMQTANYQKEWDHLEIIPLLREDPTVKCYLIPPPISFFCLGGKNGDLSSLKPNISPITPLSKTQANNHHHSSSSSHTVRPTKQSRTSSQRQNLEHGSNPSRPILKTRPQTKSPESHLSIPLPPHQTRSARRPPRAHPPGRVRRRRPRVLHHPERVPAARLGLAR